MNAQNETDLRDPATWPALTGSLRQIEWAETIRGEWADEIALRLNVIQEQGWGLKPVLDWYYSPKKRESVQRGHLPIEEVVREFNRILQSVTDSAQWIGNQNHLFGDEDAHQGLIGTVGVTASNIELAVKRLLEAAEQHLDEAHGQIREGNTIRNARKRGRK